MSQRYVVSLLLVVVWSFFGVLLLSFYAAEVGRWARRRIWSMPVAAHLQRRRSWSRTWKALAALRRRYGALRMVSVVARQVGELVLTTALCFASGAIAALLMLAPLDLVDGPDEVAETFGLPVIIMFGLGGVGMLFQGLDYALRPSRRPRLRLIGLLPLAASRLPVLDMAFPEVGARERVEIAESVYACEQYAKHNSVAFGLFLWMSVWAGAPLGVRISVLYIPVLFVVILLISAFGAMVQRRMVVEYAIFALAQALLPDDKGSSYRWSKPGRLSRRLDPMHGRASLLFGTKKMEEVALRLDREQPLPASSPVAALLRSGSRVIRAFAVGVGSLDRSLGRDHRLLIGRTMVLLTGKQDRDFYLSYQDLTAKFEELDAGQAPTTSRWRALIRKEIPLLGNLNQAVAALAGIVAVVFTLVNLMNVGSL